MQRTIKPVSFLKRAVFVEASLLVLGSNGTFYDNWACINMTQEGGTNNSEGNSVLRAHADCVATFFAGHFDPQITYVKRLPNVVESALKKSKAPHWSSTVQKYVIRDTNKRFFYGFDHRVFTVQTLGLDSWIDNINDHVDIMVTSYSKMEITKLRRLGFQINAYIKMGMTHAELCDLCFGSYLVDRNELARAHGQIDDLLLQIHGSYKGVKSVVVIAPQTSAQSKHSFLSINNLETFAEPKYLDLTIKEYCDRVSEDCLYIQIEMYKEDVPVGSIRSILDVCFQGAEASMEQVVRRIRSLDSKEKGRDGNSPGIAG